MLQRHGPEAKKAQSLQDVLSKRVVQLEAKLSQQTLEHEAMVEALWGTERHRGSRRRSLRRDTGRSCNEMQLVAVGFFQVVVFTP